MSNPQDQETDRNVEVWKIKKLIKSLQAARGFDIFLLYLFHSSTKFGVIILLFTFILC